MKHIAALILLLSLSSCTKNYTLYLLDKTPSGNIQETVTPIMLNGKYIGDVDNVIPTEKGILIPVTIYNSTKIPANSVFSIAGVKKKQIAVHPGTSKIYLQEGDTIAITHK